MNKHTSVFVTAAIAVSIFTFDVMTARQGGPRLRDLLSQASASSLDDDDDDATFAGPAWEHVAERHDDDVEAMETFRPGFTFWQHVFLIPDGSIAFGSAKDGRHLVTFPTDGDWHAQAQWSDDDLSQVLDGRELPRTLDARRELVAQLLEAEVGPVVHNHTRGLFLAPGVNRYGSFLREWGTIYERFGVPAEVGLGQALIESGFEGARRSEADAVGLCQWLERNWAHLDRLAAPVIESHNQTTQAAYCAAYVTILGTKYDSFVPALSEHHAGGTNIARVLITGGRLGGEKTRERYFRGADFARDLRLIDHERYGDLYQSYGPRSYRYAEMVFGNAANVRSFMSSIPQTMIHAMRTTRAIRLAEVTRETGLAADDVRRFNPALRETVPAGATLYLPRQVERFGRDVAFWHRPATAAYAEVLNDFVHIDATPEEWDQPAFDATLAAFERRFRDTDTEEGHIMATVLAYVRDESGTSGRRRIVASYSEDPKIAALFTLGLRARDTYRSAAAD